MQKMTFSLNVSAENYQRYYQGSAQFVVVTADDGRKLKFPANALQGFVSHEGIQGRFEIVFDNNNKLQHIKRIV